MLLTKLAGGTEKDVRPGLERLKTLKASGNLAMFASSPAELDNMLVQGQAWMAVNGSPRAFIMKDKGAPIDFAFPKEGAGYFTNYFEVSRTRRIRRLPQLLVNFLTSPEIQLVIAEGIGRRADQREGRGARQPQGQGATGRRDGEAGAHRPRGDEPPARQLGGDVADGNRGETGRTRRAARGDGPIRGSDV